MVEAVALSPRHNFSKEVQLYVRLIAGHGIEGDAHAGTTVKHRSRVARNPLAPNMRQVHLIHAELHEELRNAGFMVAPGELGENITTRGVELLSLPRGTRLRVGRDAVVELTGLREPCVQIDRFQAGLMRAVMGRDSQGQLVRKSGVMGIVVASGDVKPGDIITVDLPALPHEPLVVV